MMMLGANNLEVADVILNWVGESLRSKAWKQQEHEIRVAPARDHRVGP